MTLRELAAAIEAELVGEAGETPVDGLTGLDDMAPGCVVYVAEASRLAQAEAGVALAVLVPRRIEHSSKPLLRAENPRLALARALAALYPEPSRPGGIHPTAQLGAGVTVGEGATVGAHCVLGDGARLGRRAYLHPLVAVGRGVEIGDDTVIHPHVTLYDGVRVGARVVIQAGAAIGSSGFGYAFDGTAHQPLRHVGTVVIEDDVEIGANATIDRATFGATVIGAGTKIDNLVHVAHNVVVGRHCLLAGQTGVSGSASLGDGVVLAGQVGVVDHVSMGDGAIAGARAAVMQDVPAGAVVYGSPAHPRSEQLRIDAAVRRLPELLRTVRDLVKRVEELERNLGDD